MRTQNEEWIDQLPRDLETRVRNQSKAIVNEDHYVSPITVGCHSRQSVFIVMQDWASMDWVQKLRQGAEVKDERKEFIIQNGYDQMMRANKRLSHYLEIAKFPMMSHCYVTNVFPGIKDGEMSARVEQGTANRHFQQCISKEIDWAEPTVILALGRIAATAILSTNRVYSTRSGKSPDLDVMGAIVLNKMSIYGLNQRGAYSYRIAVGNSVPVLFMPHPSARMSKEDQEQIWEHVQDLM